MTSLWCSQRSPCWCSVDPSPMRRHTAAHFLAEGETRVTPLPPRITGRPETTGTEETNRMPLERSNNALLFICRWYFALYSKLVQDYNSAFPMILPVRTRRTYIQSWLGPGLPVRQTTDVVFDSFVRASGIICSILLSNIASLKAHIRITDSLLT